MSHFCKILLASWTVLLFSGCGASTMAKIDEPAYWQLPSNAKIALVTVDVPKKVLERAPSDFSNMRMLLHGALNAAFGGTYEIVDRSDLGFKQVIAPVQKEANKLWIFTEDTAPTLPRDQVWGAEPPKGLPTGVVEPLTLGVKILRWTLNNEETMVNHVAKTVATADLEFVCTLWTRGGSEIETVRMLVHATPEMGDTSVTSVPPRDHVLMQEYRAADAFLGDREKAFRVALENSGTWFAWPYLPHQINYQAVFDAPDDNHKAAVKLTAEGKWDEAFAVWKTMADADAKAAAAVFNMGQVKRVQGKTQEALEYFTKAAELDDKLLYRSYRDGLAARMKQVKTVTL